MLLNCEGQFSKTPKFGILLSFTGGGICIIFHINIIIIRCIFSLIFIGWEPTTWPANNCLQISVLLQIIFCACVIETTLWCENGRSVTRAVRDWFHIFSWSKEQKKYKESNKTFDCKYNLRFKNEIMLRRKPIYFCRFSTCARQRALNASGKQQHRKKKQTNKQTNSVVEW